MSLGVAKLGDLRCGGAQKHLKLGVSSWSSTLKGPAGAALGWLLPCRLYVLRSQARFAEPNPSHSRLYPRQVRTVGAQEVSKDQSGEGGWRDTLVPGVLLAEMGAPKSLLDESERRVKKEREGEGQRAASGLPSRDSSALRIFGSVL